MEHRRRRLIVAVTAAFAFLLGPLEIKAQVPDEIKSGFQQWAKQSLHPVTVIKLDAPTADLQPLRKMIGDARIVALSELDHGGAEPLEFRNRVFKYLVEDMGFDAIAIESGVVEGRIVHDYVAGGAGDLDTVAKQGITWTMDRFPQNRELITWIRNYNSHLRSGAKKAQFFGFDVPGSPFNSAAVRGPETGLMVALEYVRAVDPQEAAQLQTRLNAFLPPRKDSYANYAGLKQTERDSITSAIADLISLIEHRQFQYTDKSSTTDYEWAERAAVGARQLDAWLRHIPVGWKSADGYEFTRDATQVRERAMADNLDWIMNRVGPRGRVLVFAAVSHIASAPWIPDDLNRNMFPFGAYVKARYGSEFVNVINLNGGGEISYCEGVNPKPMSLKPEPTPSAETLFGSVNVPHYILDLRDAPRAVSLWLHQPHDHWDGFGSRRFPTASAFDIAFYVSSVTPACASKL